MEVLGNFIILRLKVLTGRAPMGIEFHKNAIAAGLIVQKCCKIVLYKLERLCCHDGRYCQQERRAQEVGAIHLPPDAVEGAMRER